MVVHRLFTVLHKCKIFQGEGEQKHFICLKKHQKGTVFSRKSHKHTIFCRSVKGSKKPPLPPQDAHEQLSHTSKSNKNILSLAKFS